MINLQAKSGLPVKLYSIGKLKLSGGLVKVEPSIRSFAALKPYLLYPDYCQNSEKAAYYMYRQVAFLKDISLFTKTALEFDLTVLQEGDFGGEYLKTIGHFHPLKPGTNVTYPEIYEVIFGKAYFLLQKFERIKKKITNFLFVKAKAGDKVIVPPNYGHVTVNPGPGKLVIANLVSTLFTSDYTFYKKHHGAAYYIVLEKGKEKIVANPFYQKRPLIKIFRAKPLLFLNIDNKPLYQQFVKEPKKFVWLNEPELYLKKLAIKNFFR